MPVPPDQVERFAALFSGYERARGTFVARRAGESGKVDGRAQTVRVGPELENYRVHLEGEEIGLGIVLLREDDTVLFGAIDYDSRTTDHRKAEAAVRKLDLPLVVCRSKSGGAHFYCFCSEPVPAALMRERLAEWTAALGMAAKTEQFPKQVSRYNAEDIGSWINLPYYRADETERYGIVGGDPVNLEDFLEFAERMRVSYEDLQRGGGSVEEEHPFYEGPPCLITLHAQGGFAEGTRNDGMTAVAVYLRKRFPDSWRQKVDEYNTLMAALPSAELQQLIKSMGRKDYAYRCKAPPINACCQRRVCRTREFGIGESQVELGGATFEIGAVTRYDYPHGEEPSWGMEINGKRIHINHKQFYNKEDFNRAAFAQANIIPVHMSQPKWLKFINELAQNAEIVPMADDATPTGQFLDYMRKFLYQSVHSASKRGILTGMIYRDGEKIWFRAIDLYNYMDVRRVKYESKQWVWHLLREQGGTRDAWNISGRMVSVWALPLDESMLGQHEDEDDTPRSLTQTEEF